MSRRMWVLAVTAWVGVVIAGSALTWLAIARAGQQVTASPAASSTQPPVVGTVGSAPTSPTSPSSSRAPGGAHPNPPPATPAPPAPATQQPATQQPGSSPTKRPGASTPKPPTPPRAVTRTWSGSPGFLTVSCTGGRASLTGASPADGWSFEHGDDSGDAVEVKFTNGGTEVQVKASCVGGVPQFQAETSGGGGGDG